MFLLRACLTMLVMQLLHFSIRQNEVASVARKHFEFDNLASRVSAFLLKNEN